MRKGLSGCALDNRLLNLRLKSNMDTESRNGSVVFEYRVSLSPWDCDPERYLLEIDGTITVWSESDDPEEPDEIVGSMKLLVVKLAEARRDQVELFYVLDFYEVEELYAPLFKKDGVFWPHLDVEAQYGDLLVIDEIKLDPRFEDSPLRNQAIETAIASFASIGVVVIKKQTLGLSTEDRCDKGYIDLEFNNFLMRDNFRLNS